MKLIKRLLILVVILGVLLVGGSFIAVQFLSKSFLEKQVSKATGREFVIAGELKPTISLLPTVAVTKVSLGNAEWGSKKEMANIGELQVQLQLMPLLSGDVKINSLSVKDADILLEKNGKRWNYEFSEEKKSSEKESDFSIDELNIENSSVTIKQGKDKTTINAKSITLAPEGDGAKFAYEGKLNNEVLNISFNGPSVASFLKSQKLSTKSLKVEFGDYKFTGNADIDLTKSVPNISGNLSTDKIVLAKGEEKKEPGDDKIPFDAFDVFNGNIKLKIGTLESGKIVLNNISAPVKISNGVANISPFKADFAGGKVESNMSLSASSSKIKLTGNNLMMEDVLTQLADMDDFSQGPTNVEFDLSGKGNTVEKILTSLSGQSNIYMKDGVYKKSLNTGSVAEFGKLLGGGSNRNQTPISCAIANVKWNNGTGNVKTMAIDTEHAYVLGKGTVRPGSNQINMTLSPNAKSPGLMSFAVPVLVSGKLDDPSFAPDPKGTIYTIGKGVAGFASGGISILANEITNKMGITGEDNPCVKGMKTGESAPAANSETTPVQNQPAQEQPAQEKNPVKAIGGELKKLF